ncbi:MAG: hypothetical protein IKM81_05470 [Fibrobacter sp.]|nr:hypothetical protein [Fibrobacter sp.]
MAGQKLETTISMTDKFSKTTMVFEKKLYDLLKPVNNLNKSLDKLGKAFQFKDLGQSLNLLKKSSTEFFFNIRNIGESFGYVRYAVVGVFNLLDKVTAKGDDLAKLSERLGFTVEELQKFEYVADLAGVSSETFVKGVKKLSEASVEAAGGTKEQVKAFKALGISVKNTDGSIKSSQELLLAMADRFAVTGKGELSASQKIYAAQKLLGKSGADMITVLNQGSAAIKEQMDELVALGIIDEDQAKKSAVYRDEVGKLKRAIDYLSISVASDLFGPMTESVKYLTWYLKSNRETLVKSIQPFINKIPEMVEVFTGALPGIIDAFMDVASTVKTVVDYIGVKWPVLLTVFSGVGLPLVVMVYSAVKSMLLFANTIWRVAYFFKTSFSSSAKKATADTAGVNKKISETAVATQKTESRLSRLLNALKRTAAGYDKLGVSAKKAKVGLEQSGNSAIMSSKKMAGALTAAWAAAEAFEKLTDKNDERYKNMSGFSKGLRVSLDVIEDIPIFGSLVKGLENLSVDKVDFEKSGVADLSSSMGDLEDSDLFRAVTSTKTVNNNHHSTIDVNFNNVPKNATIKRRGFDDPSMFGFSMSPAF